jgi:hypothetical protein
MTNRIPSSLKWLIDKRARLEHEMGRLRRLPGEAEVLLQEVEGALAAIDHALKLHDIRVNVRNIRPVRSTPPNEHKGVYGELSRTIIGALKAHEGQPMSTTAIVMCVAAERGFNVKRMTLLRRKRLRESVRYRLKNLRKAGLLVSPTKLEGKRDTRWALARPRPLPS